MKVLMLGWEFPPFFAGGLGMVCYELARALAQKEIEITYLMAYPFGKNPHSFLSMIYANKFKIKNNIKITRIKTHISAYQGYDEYDEFIKKLETTAEKNHLIKSTKELYGKNIIEEVFLYANRSASAIENEYFDIIHSHDWTTLPAAMLIKKATGKPFIAHVHITELDKTGGQMGHPEIMEIERTGWEDADKIITVSHFVKHRLIHDYGIDGRKIEVVHNGANEMLEGNGNNGKIDGNNKIVLFAGRVTLQKGPEYFIKAAKKVLEYEKNVKFLVAGTGDMLPEIMQLSKDYGIYDNVIFHGVYTRDEAELFFGMSDVFVMPSVSEPFGIVPLEAVAKGTPTIISKQSGISEVLNNTFKVDFWDTDEMAHQIISLLRYNHLNEEMKQRAFKELDDKFNWGKKADEVINIYNQLTH